MATERTRTTANRASLGRRCLPLVGALREHLIAVLAADDRDARDGLEEVADLWERLPESMHLDRGDVTHGDGKLRFLD